MEFNVGPQVLIPRPESELLVEQAIKLSKIPGPIMRSLHMLKVFKKTFSCSIMFFSRLYLQFWRMFFKLLLYDISNPLFAFVAKKIAVHKNGGCAPDFRCHSIIDIPPNLIHNPP